jgi:hypothetical protein
MVAKFALKSLPNFDFLLLSSHLERLSQKSLPFSLFQREESLFDLISIENNEFPPEKGGSRGISRIPDIFGTSSSYG